MVSEKLFYATIAVVILVGAVGVGAVYYHEISTVATPLPQHSKTFNLTLVETMNNSLNGTMQPRFFVVTQTGLVPAANISVPAHTLIVLTITAYDTPTPGSPANYSNVTGTVGNTITLMNGTIATGSMGGMSNGSMSMTGWESNVSSVPVTEIAHTITVPSLGINIPVVGGDMEIAKFYANTTGTFIWQCMTPCGTGPTGWEGAMATAGWMTGSFYVY